MELLNEHSAYKRRIDLRLLGCFRIRVTFHSSDSIYAHHPSREDVRMHMDVKKLARKSFILFIRMRNLRWDIAIAQSGIRRFARKTRS